MAGSGDAHLVALGVALICGGVPVELAGGHEAAAALPIAFGAGLLLAAPRNLAPQWRIGGYIVLLVTFVGVAVARGRDLVGWHGGELVLDAVILAVGYSLLYEHVHGIARLNDLLCGVEDGYASVMDERAAARIVEAELARSRRRGEELTFLFLEPDEQPATPEEMRHTLGLTSTAAARELERLYVRRRMSALLAEHVRRSDVVITFPPNRFLVVSSDTAADGTDALARRINDTTERDLGVSLRRGIAAFPLDGSTYSELISVATAASHASPEPTYGGRENEIAADPAFSDGIPPRPGDSIVGPAFRQLEP